MRVLLVLPKPNGESPYYWRVVDRPYAGVSRAGEMVFVFDNEDYRAPVRSVEHHNNGLVELWLDVDHMHPSLVEDVRDGPWEESAGPPPYGLIPLPESPSAPA